MAKETMRDVISCSRRTDIPAFHYAWLQERLAEGYVDMLNPYSGHPYRVDLDAGAVHSVVLWSKDFGNVLRDPGFLDLYDLYFQFTVNGYGLPLEPGVQDADSALRQMASLAERYSPGQVMWRFDPLMFVATGDPVEERMEAFSRLCYEVSCLGVAECTTSFATFYPEVRSRLAARGIECFEFGQSQQVAIARRMMDIAGENGMRLRSCSDAVLAGVPGVERARCVDGTLLENLFGGRASKAKDPGQRNACGCTKSRDIGSYGQNCGHACIYCYNCRTHQLGGQQ